MQVSVDNIDADLFGRGVRGGSFQPSDNTMHAIKTQAIGMLTEAYDKDLVRSQRSRLGTEYMAGSHACTVDVDAGSNIVLDVLCSVILGYVLQWLSCLKVALAVA